jgi:hypothetical protein
MSDPETQKRPLPGRILRSPLLHFLIAGGLLYAVLAERQPEAVPVVVISETDVAELEADWRRQTGRAPSEAELQSLIDARVDDELLLGEAFALGWHRSDLIARRRLLQNQRFLDPDTELDEEALLRRAYEQGMDRSDIVVRRRLLQKVILTVSSAARLDEPDDATLQAYLDANAARFERPERIRLDHIFLSRDRRPGHLVADATALGERLAAQAPAPEQAASLSDPFLLSYSLPLWSESMLGQRLGADFARDAFAAPDGQWSGPIASSYGLHFVWVRERRAADLPPLDELRTRLRAAVLREREQAALQAHLAALRERARIEVARPSSQG